MLRTLALIAAATLTAFPASADPDRDEACLRSLLRTYEVAAEMQALAMELSEIGLDLSLEDVDQMTAFNLGRTINLRLDAAISAHAEICETLRAD